MNGIILHGPTLIRTAPLGRRHRTPIRGRALLGCIVDEVTWPITGVALESVQKAEPVASFVNGGFPFVEAVHGAVGHGISVYVAAIVGVD